MTPLRFLGDFVVPVGGGQSFHAVVRSMTASCGVYVLVVVGAAAAAVVVRVVARTAR